MTGRGRTPAGVAPCAPHPQCILSAKHALLELQEPLLTTESVKLRSEMRHSTTEELEKQLLRDCGLESSGLFQNHI